MLQLDESGADGGDVTLLIGEGHSPRPLRVLELRIGVDAGVADAAVEAVHDHGQLNCSGEGKAVTRVWPLTNGSMGLKKISKLNR